MGIIEAFEGFSLVLYLPAKSINVDFASDDDYDDGYQNTVNT